jgi:membrane-associated phospholipid phosphatase
VEPLDRTAGGVPPDPAVAGRRQADGALEKGEVMTDVTPPIHVSGVPLESRAGRRLKAGAGGWAEHLGDHLYLLPSLFVSWLVANAGVVVLATGMVALGLFVTKVLLSVDAIVTADEWLPIWAEGQRTPFLDDASYITSHLADRYVLIPLIGITMLFFILRRRWRMASFVLQAALAEVLCYALVVYVVTRPRPPVVQMDPFDLSHSYPSGHVAASVAVYGALTLLLAAHFRDIRVRVAIWSIGALFPLVVIASRIYRGEHHPIDVTAGVLMGVGALCVALFAARTSRRVAELRKERHSEVAIDNQFDFDRAEEAPVEAPAEARA